MSKIIDFLRLVFTGNKKENVQSDSHEGDEVLAGQSEVRLFSTPPNDPIMSYVLNSTGVIDLNSFKGDSPTVNQLREDGFRLVLPLVSQGEMIGLLNLGDRMSEQDYSSDDYRMLNTLGTQASPALRVAQLAQQQIIEAQQRQRIEQELKVARVIQETLLPQEIPTIEGWNMDVFWQPAREVSGDFYEFIHLPDGRLGILVADVTDKGVPAAMVMATSRSLLRAAAERLSSPGEVLARVNDLLYPDIPARMFVTCLYLILDPSNGKIEFANAGHNLPYLKTEEGLIELRATGMPLGLMPGMEYEQKTMKMQPGEIMLLSSDGLIEAHNQDDEMYGFARTKAKLEESEPDIRIIDYLMDDFKRFAGEDHEQEDDITLLTIEMASATSKPKKKKIATFEVRSERGNERQAAEQILEALQEFGLPGEKLEKIKTAAAEATMNAMEHGNQYEADQPVHIQVLSSNQSIIIQIADQGNHEEKIPESTAPDLEAKLAGEQSPRGWGLFLIKNMVDELNIIQNQDKHVIELIVHI